MALDNPSIHTCVETALDVQSQETLVLLHPNIADLGIFDWFVPYLRSTFHVIRYDLRGFGKSDQGQDPLSFDVFSNDLLRVVEEHSNGPVHLCGLQMGATIATHFARMHPDKVSSLILLSVPCFPPEMLKTIRQHRMALRPDGAPIPIEYILKHASTLPEGHPVMKETAARAMRQDLMTCMEATKLTMTYNSLHDLVEVSCPILAISGAEDLLYPYDYFEAATAHLPNCKTVVLPHSSTLLVLDDPKTLATMVLSFCAQSSMSTAEADPFLVSMRNAIRTSLTPSEVISRKKDVPFYIQTIPTFHVFINGKEAGSGWNKRYAKSILLYLAIHQSVSREQLCDAFWPRLPFTAARKNLRVYLMHIRSLIKEAGSPDLISFGRETVFLEGPVQSDLLDLIQLTKETVLEEDEKTKLQLVHKLTALLDLVHSPALYDEWYIAIWDKLQGQWSMLLHWSAEYLARANRYENALVQLELALERNDDDSMFDQALDLAFTSNNQLLIDYWTKKHEQRLEKTN